MDPNNSKGANLIFLISQPRAGSTMLQKILAAHPEIYTVSEPWIALHPLFALRDQGITVNYDPRLAYQGVQEFLRKLPEREEAYWESVRRMLSYLYGRALKGTGKSIFLDKTPRYYFVLTELQRVFPNARFVFLLRNPIAVLSSILETWVKSADAVRLSPFRYDLLAAPRLILEGIRAGGLAAIVVRYEELTSAPHATVQRLCGDLGITFCTSMIEYGATPPNRERWAYGDQGTVYDQIRPVAERTKRWRYVLKQSSEWKNWAHDYLRALGPGVVGDMGYSYEELCADLATLSEGAFSELRRDDGAGEPRWEEPGPLDELAEARRLLVERTAELERSGEDLRGRTDELVEARRLLVERTTEMERSAADLRGRTGELVEARRLLVERTAELERSGEDLRGRTGELVEARRLLVERTTEMERSAADLRGRTGELVEARRLLVERTAELERSGEDLRGRTGELVEARRLLVERTAELERSGKDLRGRTEELLEARRLLVERTPELERSGEDLRGRTEELVEARRLLVERTAELERSGEDLRGRTEELVETRRLLVERTAELDRSGEDLRGRTEELVETRRLLVERTAQAERTNLRGPAA